MPGKTAVLFKVAEDGKHAVGSWGFSPLKTANSPVYVYRISLRLQECSYIVRHELIALQNAA